MKRAIGLPRRKGKASRQAHTNLPEGTYERELGKAGFFGPSAHFYHAHPPTAWIDFEGPLRPRAFDLGKIGPEGEHPWQAPPVLHNDGVKIRYWRLETGMDSLARNADGDELLFVHEGAGDLYCDFGRLPFEAGDYILIPRTTMWRIACETPVSLLLIEATEDSFMLPEKGLVGQHAIFDPGVLETPDIDDAFIEQAREDVEWRVRIKRRQEMSTATYPFNPLDAVGWKGDLCVLKLNIRDIRPLMSHRYHVPPSAHTIYLCDACVVCTFVPRPFESDPDALKVPFFHDNDYDEVIFYHAGDFFSRDNIDAGMMTFHPNGVTHGPHPKALERMFKQTKTATDEYAVMIDTKYPLTVGETATRVEDGNYVNAWRALAEKKG